jgi:hypothetical protein
MTMGRKPIGKRAMTDAERQAKQREKTLTKTQAWREAFVQIATTQSLAQARALAREALAYSSAENSLHHPPAATSPMTQSQP